jgi:hypothetical protein
LHTANDLSSAAARQVFDKKAAGHMTGRRSFNLLLCGVQA